MVTRAEISPFSAFCYIGSPVRPALRSRLDELSTRRLIRGNANNAITIQAITDMIIDSKKKD